MYVHKKWYFKAHKEEQKTTTIKTSIKMRVNLQDKSVRVVWNYDRTSKKCKTTCFIDKIVSLSEMEAISSGNAYKSKEDQFEKEKARKISLKRALLDSDAFDYVDRKAVWDAYFSRRPAKKEVE